MSGTDTAEGLHRLEVELSKIEESERQRLASGVILCIPALNKEKPLKEIVPAVVPLFKKVIVCDDGSIDATASAARKAGAFVMSHDEQLGKTKTVADLMEAASQDNPEVVVIMELEGKNDPSSIPELIAPLLKNEADIATAVRETEKMRASSGEFVALNAKALEVRAREDFFNYVSEGKVEELAAAANLRFRIVALKPRMYSPSPLDERTRGGIRGWWSHTMKVALIQRPFFYVGLPGIELTAAGLGLVILSLYLNRVNGSLDVPLGVIGAVALFLGVSMLIAYALIFMLKNLYEEWSSSEPSAPSPSGTPA